MPKNDWQSTEFRKALIDSAKDEGRERREKEELKGSFELQAKDDARRWLKWFKEHPGGTRAEKCLQEAAAWRREMDDWIIRTVGPFRSKRKKKKKKEMPIDPELEYARGTQGT